MPKCIHAAAFGKSKWIDVHRSSDPVQYSGTCSYVGFKLCFLPLNWHTRGCAFNPWARRLLWNEPAVLKTDRSIVFQLNPKVELIDQWWSHGHCACARWRGVWGNRPPRYLPTLVFCLFAFFCKHVDIFYQWLSAVMWQGISDCLYAASSLSKIKLSIRLSNMCIRQL